MNMSEYEALRIVLELARKSPISNDAEKNKKEQEAIDIVCNIAERLEMN